MADTKHPDPNDAPENSALTTDADADKPAEVGEEADAEEKLQLDVQVQNRSACERHITVTIGRDDINRYYEKEFSEMMPTAQVPGFRPGRAPRKLVEARFRKDVTERVKSALLMASLAQVNEEQKLAAISEPDIDLEAVEMPAEGSMTFEFDLEVRPEFDLPRWKGLTIEKPVHEFTNADVERTLENVLANRGRLVPHDGPAEVGDYITTNLTFRLGDQVLSSAKEEVIRIRPVLSFRDGKIEAFDKLMSGVRSGETRVGETKLSEETDKAELRGATVKAEFEVLEVKRLELPEMNAELLEDLGGFENVADLKDAIKDQLELQLEYDRRQRARQQITAALTVAANWELPRELLARQSHRELERAVLELQRSGFSEDNIRAHENELRQHSREATARALKEHFILERIAEEEKIDVAEADYEQEIALIARQTRQAPRRVRARLEKGGSMDVLRNQIVERKVIDLILEHADFVEVPYQMDRPETEAIDQAMGGQESDIPEAKPGGEASPGGRPEEPPVHV